MAFQPEGILADCCPAIDSLATPLSSLFGKTRGNHACRQRGIGQRFELHTSHKHGVVAIHLALRRRKNRMTPVTRFILGTSCI
jgi:hypothetical protein